MPLGENISRHKLIKSTEHGDVMEEEPYFVKEPEGGRRHGGIPPSLMPRLLKVLKAARNGDFSVRLPEEDGYGAVAVVFNEFMGLNQGLSNEITRISKVIGEEGKLTERAGLGTVQGTWAINIESLNSLINAMAQPTTEVGRVITAVAEGDLSKKMRMEIEGKTLKGEFARIGTIVNTMVGQLGSFASEVTRVAKEVGTDGKLGGQAKVEGVSGTWKESDTSGKAGGLKNVNRSKRL